jgi:hypothetical protein
VVVQTLMDDGIRRGIQGFFLQEPYWGFYRPVTHPSYDCIHLDCGEAKPRVLAYWKKNISYKCEAVTRGNKDPDILVVDIWGPGLEKFQLVNVYNEKRDGRK